VAKLVYSAIASLDGFVEDERGSFDWAAPDEEVHAFVNELERPIGTYLYGRRLYETMAAWETMALEDEPQVVRDFAEIWRGADKIVYSTTLESASTSRTRLERTFTPERIRELKARAERDVGIGGATLAAQALDAGLVDELRLLLVPVLVGGGKRAVAATRQSAFELRETQRFGSGVVYLRYCVGGS
jgi:dihydrofolate reductase